MSRFFASKFSTAVAGLLMNSFNPIYSEELMPPSRSEIPAKNKWNVEALYPDAAHWQRDLLAVKKDGWANLQSYRGKLNDPKMMKDFLDSYLAFNRKLEKLYTYIHLRFDEDQGNDEFKSGYGSVMGLNSDFSSDLSWLDPEILSLSDATLNDPSLKEYKFYFDQILRARPHTLSADKEELITRSGKALQASHKAFSALNNADLTFKPAIDSSGNEVALSNGSYGLLIQSPDRNLRKTAVLHLHQSYGAHVNTLCELLQGQAEAHWFNAKTRNFKDSVSAALFSKCVNRTVVDQLIETVKKNSHLMAKYIDLRKKVLKLDAIHAYDLACSLVPKADVKLSYDEACAAVIESVAPLGKDYQDALRQGILVDRWVDPFENEKKRSGAYSSGCYDSMPYILMNFHGTLNDTNTLAHEAGHSMHSYLSRKNQPYIYSQYSIFVAEVASTFNEQLLMDLLMARAKTKEEKADLLSDQIDRIRGTIFRQTMFAEFELKIHDMVEQGKPLTPKVLNEMYAGLLRDYYGAEFVIDEEIACEWARIPHFYYNFYVYQYATGISAAMALHSQATQSTEARDKYLKFLSSGGSKYPLEVLKDAGVDMTTSAPVEAAMKRFEFLLNELEKNLL